MNIARGVAAVLSVGLILFMLIVFDSPITTNFAYMALFYAVYFLLLTILCVIAGVGLHILDRLADSLGFG